MRESKSVKLEKLDEVVLIEEAWTSEVNKYLAKNGYDELL